MSGISGTVIVALSNNQLVMFDTKASEITYTNKHFAKSIINVLTLLQLNDKFYLLAHHEDKSLSLFSFPNPQLLDTFNDVLSFQISNR